MIGQTCHDDMPPERPRTLIVSEDLETVGPAVTAARTFRTRMSWYHDEKADATNTEVARGIDEAEGGATLGPRPDRHPSAIPGKI